MRQQHFLHIDIVRIVLIVLMVFYHSFCFYDGVWQMPSGTMPVPAYSFLSKLSYSFFLETFVFISGYLYGNGSLKNARKKSYIKLTVKKFKRLMIPSIIFSAVYYLLFKKPEASMDVLVSILSGCGHLWFLPMLFGCFVIMFIIENVGIINKYCYYIVSLLLIMSVMSMPFRIDKVFYYFCFFYFGYNMTLYEKVNRVNNKILICVFAVMFVVNGYILPPSGFADNTWLNAIFKVLTMLSRVFCSFCGMVLIMGLCSFISYRPNITRRYKMIASIASCGMGVYIVQQFVLMWLYYKTSYCSIINIYCIPWLAFVLTLCISLGIVFIARKIKLGRYLFG